MNSTPVPAPNLLLRPMGTFALLGEAFRIGWRCLPALALIYFVFWLLDKLLPSGAFAFPLQILLSLPQTVLSLKVVLPYIGNASGTPRQIVSGLTWRVIGRLWGVNWRYFGFLVLALCIPLAAYLLGTKLVALLFGSILLLLCIASLPILMLAEVMCVTENATPFQLIRRATRLCAKQWPKALVF